MDIEETLSGHDHWFLGRARRLRQNWDAVEDLMQEGRLAMFEAYHSWDGRGDQLGWMRKVAIWRMTRVAFPQEGRKGAPDLIEIAEYDNNLLDTAHHDHPNDMVAHHNEIHQAIRDLPERSRLYVWMRFWQKASQAEMEKEFGKSPHSAFHRGGKNAKLDLQDKLSHLRSDS